MLFISPDLHACRNEEDLKVRQVVYDEQTGRLSLAKGNQSPPHLNILKYCFWSCVQLER